MPRRRSRKSPLSPEDVMALADFIADATPVVGDAKAVYEVSNALKEDDWRTAAMSAMGFIPVVGDVAKRVVKSGNTWAEQGGKAVNAVSQRPRDMADIPMKGRRSGLADTFLEQHGYPHYDGIGPRPKGEAYYEWAGDNRVIAHSPVGMPGGKIGMEQKTFDNPTLKQLKNWMGY